MICFLQAHFFHLAWADENSITVCHDTVAIIGFGKRGRAPSHHATGCDNYWYHILDNPVTFTTHISLNLTPSALLEGVGDHEENST